MIPAQRTFVNTLQFKYPDERVFGAAPQIDSSTIDAAHLALLPTPEAVAQSCSRPVAQKESPCSHVFCSLRAYVDNQTLRCPAVLFDSAKALLERLMAPLGVRFHGTAEVWDSVADPDSGLVTLGVPLWSGHTSKDAADDTPSLLYAVGQHAFVLAKCLDKLEQMQTHQNEDVYKKAMHILETYFGIDDEEDDAIAPEATQQGFVFQGQQQQQPGGYQFS